MAKNSDEKLNIQEAIKAFAKDDISTAGINFFSVLGYDTTSAYVTLPRRHPAVSCQFQILSSL